MNKKQDIEHPAWLKAMQNGSIGEARSRAFLLDRFWVLERSVDIDGADLIIQRRLTTRNLLDREAPRLGVVQVKFYGTAKAHYVHKAYIVDSEEISRSEFFVLCHAGEDEDQKMYLLTSEDIQKSFTSTIESGAEKYYLPLSQISTNGQYEIKNRKLALDRIENRLALADFTTNRRFMSWVLPSADVKPDAILPEYREPVENDWGDIPTEFAKLKKTAQSAMYNVEEIYNLLRTVANEVDPLKAEEAIEEIAYNCRGGHGWYISLPDDLGDEEFFRACKEHKEIVNELKKDGLLDEFIGMRAAIQKQITSFIEPHFPLDKNKVLTFTINYKPKTLLLESVECQIVEAAEFVGQPVDLDKYGQVVLRPDEWQYSYVSATSPGELKGHWLPGRYGYTDNKTEATFTIFRQFDFELYRRCMGLVYKLKYQK